MRERETYRTDRQEQGGRGVDSEKTRGISRETEGKKK